VSTTKNAISRRVALRTTLQAAAGAALMIGFEVPRAKAANEKPVVKARSRSAIRSPKWGRASQLLCR